MLPLVLVPPPALPTVLPTVRLPLAPRWHRQGAARRLVAARHLAVVEPHQVAATCLAGVEPRQGAATCLAAPCAARYQVL